MSENGDVKQMVAILFTPTCVAFFANTNNGFCVFLFSILLARKRFLYHARFLLSSICRQKRRISGIDRTLNYCRFDVICNILFVIQGRQSSNKRISA